MGLFVLVVYELFCTMKDKAMGPLITENGLIIQLYYDILS